MDITSEDFLALCHKLLPLNLYERILERSEAYKKRVALMNETELLEEANLRIKEIT